MLIKQTSWAFWEFKHKYIHFTNEESEAYRLSDLLKVAEVGREPTSPAP